MINPALQRRLAGEQDSRSTQAIFTRGANIYHGGLGNAHAGGGPQFGRPRKSGLNKPLSKSKPKVKSSAESFEVNPYMAAIQRRLLKG